MGSDIEFMRIEILLLREDSETKIIFRSHTLDCCPNLNNITPSPLTRSGKPVLLDTCCLVGRDLIFGNLVGESFARECVCVKRSESFVLSWHDQAT